MNREEREAIIVTHMEGENVLDYDSVMATFSHPRYELIGNGAVFDGEAQVRQYFAMSRTPFPDQRNELIGMHHTDDGILVEFWLLGTHNGPLMVDGEVVAPTGKAFKVRMASLFLFDDEGIVAERVWFDQLSILQQLGIKLVIAK